MTQQQDVEIARMLRDMFKEVAEKYGIEFTSLVVWNYVRSMMRDSHKC